MDCQWNQPSSYIWVSPFMEPRHKNLIGSGYQLPSDIFRIQQERPMGFALQSPVGMWCCCPGFLDAVWLKEGGLGIDTPTWTIQPTRPSHNFQSLKLPALPCAVLHFFLHTMFTFTEIYIYIHMDLSIDWWYIYIYLFIDDLVILILILIESYIYMLITSSFRHIHVEINIYLHSCLGALSFQNSVRVTGPNCCEVIFDFDRTITRYEIISVFGISGL